MVEGKKTGAVSAENSGPGSRAVKLLLFLLAAGFMFSSWAGDIAFQRVSHEQGLSQATVEAILQDHYGFMWFGTQEGLNRYDGRSFEVYLHDKLDPDSLSDSSIKSLFQDSAGRLWIGTSSGLNLYDRARNRFIRIAGETIKPGQINVIFEDRAGRLWIGDARTGLFLFDYSKNSFQRMEHEANNQVGLERCNHQHRIRGLSEDRAGGLWVATDGDGVLRLDPSRTRFDHFRSDSAAPFDLPANEITAVLVSKEDQVLIGTSNSGLLLLDPERGIIDRFPEVAATLPMILALYIDQAGTLWLAGNNGIMSRAPGRENFETYHHLPTNNLSLSDDVVRSIFEDRGGVLWLGTQSGLSKFNLNIGSFSHIQVPGTQESSVDAIGAAPGGDVWIGGQDGLSRFSPHSRQLLPLKIKGRPSQAIQYIYAENDDLVWLGMEGHLVRYEVNTNRTKSFELPMVDNEPGSIVEILPQNKDALLVATSRSGLFVVENGQPQLQPHPLFLKDKATEIPYLCRMVAGEAGQLWLGSDRGLISYDPNTGETKTIRLEQDSEDGLHQLIWTLFFASNGDLWIGVHAGGLYRWQASDRRMGKEVFTHYSKEDGLPSNMVHFILEDAGGSIWIAGDKGLSRFQSTQNTFLNFDTTRGLANYSFNPNVGARGSAGQLFFGSQNGITWFEPSEIQLNTRKPEVLVTSILVFNNPRVFDRPIYELSAIELDQADQMVSFEFAAMDFTQPERNCYRYRLDGFDNQWHDLKYQNRATYTNLPRGNYSLLVQASNNDGIWNTETCQLDIKINPPLWDTWWARGFYGLLAASSLFAYYRSHARKLAQGVEYNRALETEVQERTRELSRRHTELAALHEKLEEASRTDHLTGLPNRRFMLRFIQEHFGKPQENPEERWLFSVFDLDGFRAFNDKHGHVSGDLILVQVKQVLQKVLGESDYLIRWDSDEFMILSPNPTLETARSTATHLCQAIGGHSFAIGGGDYTRLTCSVGFSFFPFAPERAQLLDWQKVLMIADMALFVARKAGGNGWVGLSPGTRELPEDLYSRFKENPEQLVTSGLVEVCSSARINPVLSWQ